MGQAQMICNMYVCTYVCMYMNVFHCLCYKVENKMFTVNNLVSIKIQKKKNKKILRPAMKYTGSHILSYFIWLSQVKLDYKRIFNAIPRYIYIHTYEWISTNISTTELKLKLRYYFSLFFVMFFIFFIYIFGSKQK